MLKRDTLRNRTIDKNNWVSNIRECLVTNGFGDIWNSEHLDLTTIETVKRRIINSYHQTWHFEVNSLS